MSDYRKNGIKVFKMSLKRCPVPLYAKNTKELAKILTYYVQAQKLNYGKDVYEVDHIIPINHPLVCGLHCAENLQIVTKQYNSKKSNNFKPYVQRKVD